MSFGVTLLVAGGVVAALLVGLPAGPLWRLLLFLPFWASAVGVLQARRKK